MSLRTRQFLQWSAGIAVLALILRLPWMYNALEYDELWSLQNYAPLSCGKILTDLGLPNNHPVNTLLMKLLKNISGAPQVIRAGVFLAGSYVVFLTMKLAGAVEILPAPSLPTACVH